MQVYVVGDSISVGIGATQPNRLGYAALLHRNCRTLWPEFEGSDLSSVIGQDIDVVKIARSGATSGQILETLNEQQKLLQGPERSVVVMTLGGNDLKNALIHNGLAALRGMTGANMAAIIARTSENLRRIFGHFQDGRRFPQGVQIFAANVYDPSDGVALDGAMLFGIKLPNLVHVFQHWGHAYVELTRSMGVTLVDAFSAFRGHGMSAAEGESWLADWIHPNDRGHHELRRLFLDAMALKEPGKAKT